MYAKEVHVFARKTQRQNKLPLPLLCFLFQILFDMNFSIWVLAIKVFDKFNRYI